MHEDMRCGAVEAGGTKFVIAAGTGPADLTEPFVVPTTTPEETIAATVETLRALGPLRAVGVASFGPLDLDEQSATYGAITQTPKPGWSGVSIRDALASKLGVAVGIDTDVTGAAVAEARWGAGVGNALVMYVTVGTGIGIGMALGGRPLHGRHHPEGGHVRLPRHPKDDFAGVCPFHRDCLEGLTAGPAIEARWGRPATDLGKDLPEAVALTGWYLGTAVANLLLIVAPDRLIIGGGVSKLPGLLDTIRARAGEVVAGYASLTHRAIVNLVTPPELGDRSGVLGGIALAEIAAGDE